MKLLGFIALALVSCSKAEPPAAVVTPAQPPVTVSSPAVTQQPESVVEDSFEIKRTSWREVEIVDRLEFDDKLVKAGKSLYEAECLQCHGKAGMGDGPASVVMEVKPRNYTTGKFKLKTTPQGKMPTDEDLFRTISAGIAPSGMRPFDDMSPQERWSLVAYVKDLAAKEFPADDEDFISELNELGAIQEKFKKGDEDYIKVNWFKWRKPTDTLAVPTPPEKTSALITKGKDIFFSQQAACFNCHGDTGIGDGPSAKDLKDDWGNPIKPADMTRGKIFFKRGAAVEDIYTTLTVGIEGTPMPSFASSLAEDERWAVAHYVTSLYRKIHPGEAVFYKAGCLACHTIGGGKFIGPDLAGVTERRTKEWIKKWLTDPPGMLSSDATARQLLEEFQIPMPNMGLKEREIDAVIEYFQMRAKESKK